MKTFYRLLIWTLCFFIGLQSSQAQQTVPNLNNASPKIKKWRVANFGVHIGSYFDSYSNMSQAGLESMIRGTDLPSIDLGHLIPNSDYYALMEGGRMGAYIALHPFSYGNQDYKWNQELRLGLSVNLDRELMLNYYNIDDTRQIRDITYCLIENEAILSASYLFKKQIGRYLNVYAGPGANIGKTFNNTMLAWGSDFDHFESKASASTYTRLYAEGGVSLRTFKGLTITAETQLGAGMQIVHKGKNNFVSNTTAVTLGLQYQFGY